MGVKLGDVKLVPSVSLGEDNRLLIGDFKSKVDKPAKIEVEKVLNTGS